MENIEQMVELMSILGWGPSTITGVMGAIGFVVVLLVLAFLTPFFIFGTNRRTKQCSRKLGEIAEVLSRLESQLAANKPQENETAVY